MRRLTGRYSEVSPRSVVRLPHVVRPPRVVGLPGLAGLACDAFVVTETNGHWASAIVVPGTKSRNTGHKAQVSAVSCASAGNCAATGYYTDFASGFAIPFTAEEHA